MIRVAAFDLDGTILDGESPLKLTTSLLRHRQLPIHKAFLMGIWGIRYRLRLPLVESTPRELLFSALTEPTVEEVDAEIMDVFNQAHSPSISAPVRFARSSAVALRA